MSDLSRQLQECYTMKKCECGGPLFQVSDWSNDTYKIKCGHTKFILADKTAVYSENKKSPCGFQKIISLKECNSLSCE